MHKAKHLQKDNLSVAPGPDRWSVVHFPAKRSTNSESACKITLKTFYFQGQTRPFDAVCWGNCFVQISHLSTCKYGITCVDEF